MEQPNSIAMWPKSHIEDMNTVNTFSTRFLTLLRIVAALLLAASVTPGLNAQGIISMYNAGHDLRAAVSDSRTGELLAGRDWLGQLYYSPTLDASEAVLVPVPGPTAYFGAGTPFSPAGYFDLSQDLIRVLSDVPPDESVSVQLRVWNAAAGTTYEEAASSPIGVVGKSEVGRGGTGFPGLAPGTIRRLEPFSVYPVPEPSALCMILTGILGAAVLSHRK
jgi:hypothetical protein